MHQTPATTPASAKPPSLNDSASPPSAQGSGGSTAGSTPTSYGAAPGKGGVVPIAAAPPKPTPIVPVSTSAASRPVTAVAPKRQRRHEKQGIRAEEQAVENEDISAKLASPASSKKPQTTLQQPPSASAAAPVQGFSTMTGIQQPVSTSGAPVNGQAEWEWLTMSL